MSLLTEQLSSAAQNQIATQIAFLQAFSQSAFSGLEKLISLNLSIARQSVEHANQVTRDLLALKEPKELFQFNQAHTRPQLEELMSYGRELVNISRNTRAGIWQAVNPGFLSISAVITPAGVHIDATKTPKAASVKPQTVKPVPANGQLTLLAEPEAKSEKTAKPVVKPKSVTTVAVKNEPAGKQQAAKAAAKKTSVEKAEMSAPVIEPDATSILEVAQPLPVAAQAVEPRVTEQKDTATPAAKKVTSPVSKTVAEKKSEASLPEEKKPAVKFPTPAAIRAKAGKPTASKTAPASKAKSSAATGIKKAVRQ